MTSLQILTPEEVKKFNTPPMLSISEQKYYFQIPHNLLETIETDMNQIYFIALFGCFKKENKFFDKFDNQIYWYIAHDILNIAFSSEDISVIPKSTFYRYKEIIKNYFAIQTYVDETANILLKEATTLASNFTHRKKIFYALVNLSKKLKIEVPSYTELSRIISLAINSQKQDILDRLAPFIKDEKLNVLDEFLQKDTSTKNRWHLAQYKKLEHATNKKKMISSLCKFNTIKSKFQITQSIIEEIGLTPKIAQYHARWIEKSQVFQVKRKKDIESNFLLLCFVYYQYFIRNDNLIDRFIATVQTAKNASLRAQKEYSFEMEPQKNRVIQSLEDANLSTLNDIV